MVRGSKVQGSKPVQSRRGSAVVSNKQGTASPGVVSNKETKESKDTKKASSSNPSTSSLVISCSACGIVIGDEVKALQCDRCQSNDSWKCIDCVNLPSDVYDHLLSNDNCSLKWFCDHCDVPNSTGTGHQNASDSKIDSLLFLVEKLLDKLTGLETKLNDKCDVQEVSKIEIRLKEAEEHSSQQGRDFEKRIAAIEGKLSNSCDHVIGGACSTVNGAGNEGMIKLAVQEEINKQVVEVKDIESRKKNVIIYRVPEKKSKSVLERKEHDAEFVKDLLDGVFNMDVQNGDIDRMYRLGQWTEDKSRPLLIGFKQYEHKEQIMSNLWKFKENSVTKFQGISVSHDLHPAERLEIKNMVEDAKKKHLEEEADDTENYWFRVVGHGNKRRVIKFKKRN